MTVRAAVDIGTNSMRLLIADDDTEVGRWARVTGLGKGVDRSGRLSEDAIERTLAVLADYGEECRRAGVHRLRAVATSASRDAGNAGDFLERAHSMLGVRPEVISGIEEASLAYAGATSDAPGDGPFLVIDIGGGSTEFVWSTEETITAVSTHIGSVRLTDRVAMDRPATFEELHSAAGVAEGILSEVAMPEREWTVLGVAGTWTSLSAINLRLASYDRTLVHHSTLDRRAVDRLVGNLASLTIEQTAAIRSLDPARAPVILAGSIIAREAMRSVGASEVIVSEHDLLDGLVASM
jgi:exopolyphosphatase/guanosine-5'-triphosphate,3'-diphosphate pyrophosphatase